MTGKRMNVVSNLIWRLAERSGAQLVSFIVSIILARILAPDVFGQVSLMLVFINIVNVFVDSGLGNALIQKKDADELDFSTVFYANICFCFILYFFVYILSPYVAQFYNDSSMTPMLRVLGITILISGVKNIQLAYVSRNMIFKRFFFATLGGTIGAAIIGCIMAYCGWGAWAIVAQHVFNTAVDTIILWITVKWRPIFSFSFTRLRTLFSYGWKLLASSLIDTVYNNLRQLIIGRLYSAADLAYYNQADKFPNVIVSNINSSIDSVLLPTMSKEQDNIYALKSMTRRSITTSTFIMAPLMFGLIATAPNVIKLVLTDKWLDCTFYLRVFCITYLFYPIHTANLNAIKALGRSDLFLKLEILKKFVGLSILLISMHFGVKAMALSTLISSFLSQVINAWPNKKLLNYSYLDQLIDILPNVILAGIMSFFVIMVESLNLNYILCLIIQICIGVILYLLLSIITKNKSLLYIKTMFEGGIRHDK